MLTNIAASPFGESAIAAMGIVNRLMSLESNALYGFLKGYSPLAGYNYAVSYTHLDVYKRQTGTIEKDETIRGYHRPTSGTDQKRFLKAGRRCV